ncbi:hypothetical protein FHY55_18005 [Oceanicola sp. D3]|uniref:hypothetical protein n=1 Tax=Oceanicola sp. D3 TaxID=2587163 RepID=UPI001121325F|nr:hypothetical protein [Oceanicola sp. D3]QDC11009.1 hypothetical protein FHY55_18005 [Oceanicola sp. D3]
MRFYFIPAVLLCSAAPVAAEPVGVPSGCAVTATMLRSNCEMVQVLRCEADAEAGPQRVDVYLDGTYLGEEEWQVIEMVRWRRGNRLQEMAAQEGSYAALATLSAGEVMELKADRSRRMTGTDTPAMVDPFDIRIEALGEGRRELASGQRRMVKRFRYSFTAPKEESGDTVMEYDPALGLPIWAESWTTRGAEAVYGPGHTSFMSGAAPEGAPCTPN